MSRYADNYVVAQQIKVSLGIFRDYISILRRVFVGMITAGALYPAFKLSIQSFFEIRILDADY